MYSLGPEPWADGTQSNRFIILLLQGISTELLTPNLHHLTCVLPEQEKAMGSISFYSELWLERMIQLAKRTVKFRCTSEPEKVIANDIALASGLIRLQRSSGCVLKSFAELVPSMVGQAEEGEGGPGASYAIGSRSPLDPDLWSDLMPKVQRMLTFSAADFALIGWNAGKLDLPLVVEKHTRAMLREAEVVTSKSYLMAESRDSPHIYMWCEANEGGYNAVGRV